MESDVVVAYFCVIRLAQKSIIRVSYYSASLKPRVLLWCHGHMRCLATGLLISSLNLKKESMRKNNNLPASVII